MAKFEDLKGQKFGYWTVVERAENHPATRSAQWLCECECGTKKIIRASALKSGKSKSCGCHKNDYNKIHGGTLAEAQALKTGACDTIEEARKRFGGSDDGNPGYVVKYPDGYISWSPKDVFEKSYMQVQENPKLISGVSIGEHMVNDFISYIETSTVGYKTTMVRCVLRNGFEIIETSAWGLFVRDIFCSI